MKCDLANLEGGSSDTFIDAVKGWLNGLAIDRHLCEYHDMTADVTNAWDVPVKPEWFVWSHPIRTQDYTVQLSLHDIKRDGGRLIATYEVEVV